MWFCMIETCTKHRLFVKRVIFNERIILYCWFFIYTDKYTDLIKSFIFIQTWVDELKKRKLHVTTTKSTSA
jgi:hypothetical protein